MEEKDEPVSAQKDEIPKVDVEDQKDINVFGIVGVVVAFILVAGLAGFVICNKKKKAKEEQHEKDL